jgi:hypothetical protein
MNTSPAILLRSLATLPPETAQLPRRGARVPAREIEAILESTPRPGADSMPPSAASSASEAGELDVAEYGEREPNSAGAYVSRGRGTPRHQHPVAAHWIPTVGRDRFS